MLLVISLFGDLFVDMFSLSAIVIYLGITKMNLLAKENQEKSIKKIKKKNRLMLIPLPKEAENWDSPRKKNGWGGGGILGLPFL